MTTALGGGPTGSDFDLRSIDLADLRTDSLIAWIATDDQMYLDRAIEVARHAYEDEEKRAATIEGKASTVIAALGIAASVILGGSGLLLNNADKLRLINIWALIVLLIPYVIALALLGLALIRGMRAAKVGFMARPDPGDVIRVRNDAPHSVALLSRTYLANLLVAYERNRRANNEKAGNLQGGQTWFLLAAGFLVLGAFVVMLVAVGIRLAAT